MTFVWHLYDLCLNFVRPLYELCMTFVLPLYDLSYELLYDLVFLCMTFLWPLYDPFMTFVWPLPLYQDPTGQKYGRMDEEGGLGQDKENITISKSDQKNQAIFFLVWLSFDDVFRNYERKYYVIKIITQKIYILYCSFHRYDMDIFKNHKIQAEKLNFSTYFKILRMLDGGKKIAKRFIFLPFFLKIKI